IGLPQSVIVVACRGYVCLGGDSSGGPIMKAFCWVGALAALLWLPLVGRAENEALRRGKEALAKRDFETAVKDLTEAIRLDPKDASLYHSRAQAAAFKGDLDRAIADFTEAIRLDPKYTSAHYNRGLAYEKKMDLEKAIQDYTAAI